MGTTQRFRNGVEFPNEGFVQLALDRHFADLGFTEHCGSRADIDLRNPSTGVRWVVEAKGDTKQNAGLDFKSGLGQLFLGMSDAEALYGIAIPDIPRFRALCARLPERVRASLNIHWLLVDVNAHVRIVPPGQILEIETNHDVSV
jgi:hypothetical protein